MSSNGASESSGVGNNNAHGGNASDSPFNHLYAEEDAGGKIMTMGDNGQMAEYLGPSVDEIEEREPESLDLDMKNGGQKVWLVKLPKRLADRWRDLSQIEGKELGKLRIKNGNGDDVKLMLDHIAGVTDDLPLQYKIMMNKRIIDNEYIFTEQNLNNFKTDADVANSAQAAKDSKDLRVEAKAEARRRRLKRWRERKFAKTPEGQAQAAAAAAAGQAPQQQARPRYIPFVKTIPKKSALVGTVYHECQVLPSITDKEYIKQLRRDLKPKQRAAATLLSEPAGLIQSNTGPSITKGNTSQFLRQDRHKNKADGRNIRMPQKDLLDLLFRLFDEYDYWTMKGLKERTKQPETYLKESLEKVAVLIKRGPYALKYALKPEYKTLKEAERARIANESKDKNGDAGDGKEGADNNSDAEDFEMEDVV